MSQNSNKLYAYIGYKDIVLRVRIALSFMRIFRVSDHCVNSSWKKASAIEEIDASIDMNCLEMKSRVKIKIRDK